MRLFGIGRGEARERAIREAEDLMLDRMLTEREQANGAERKRLGDEIRAAMAEEKKALPALVEREAVARAKLDRAEEVRKLAFEEHRLARGALDGKAGEISGRINIARSKLAAIRPAALLEFEEELRAMHEEVRRHVTSAVEGRVNSLTLTRTITTDAPSVKARALAIPKAIAELEKIATDPNADVVAEIARVRKSIPEIRSEAIEVAVR